MTAVIDLTGGLPDLADLPAQTRPDVPLWIENFWWLAFDEQSRTGVMVHLASLPHDFTLVRQTVLVFLPDGRLFADLSIGARSGDHVGGATASARCTRPFSAWQLTMNGTAQPTTIDELWSGPLPSGPRSPVRFDLTAQCLSPAWNADGAMTDQEWASHHYQQTVAVSGNLEVDGTEYSLNCIGVRDHSRGARDMSGWGGHCLLTAAFPSGRAFGMFVVMGSDGATVLNAAYTAVDGLMQRGTVQQRPPELSTQVLEPESFGVEFDVANGVEQVQVRTPPRGIQRSILSMLPPNDLVIGLYRAHPHSIALSWVPAQCNWGGEIGHGLVERSALAASVACNETAT